MKDGPMNSPASGWQRDPTARHEYRYWDGSRWTDDVSDRGVTATDPMPPPGPGADPTQVIDPTQAFPSAPQAPPAPTQTYGQPPAPGYGPDGAAGFGPYGSLPNQAGAYGSYGNGGGPPAAGPPPGSGAKTGLFVGIGVLVVAAVAGIAFLVTKDDDSNETSTNPLSDQTNPSDPTVTTLPSDPGGDTGDDTSDDTSDDPGEIDSLDDLANVDPDDITEEQLIPLVAAELSSSGLMSEDEATCVAEVMFENLDVEDIIALGESGTDPMSALTPEQMNVLTSGMVDCMGGAIEP
jgi:hypothetical protein